LSPMSASRPSSAAFTSFAGRVGLSVRSAPSLDPSVAPGSRWPCAAFTHSFPPSASLPHGHH
jgi:hypothetical protein